MKSPAFTQGEWTVKDFGFTGGPYVVYVGANTPTLNAQGQLSMHGSQLIAEVSSDPMRWAAEPGGNVVYEGSANSRLIGAAPKLYAALVCARDYVSAELMQKMACGMSDTGSAQSTRNDLAVIDAALAQARGGA